ncbi:MAG TPA: PilZ domain-containing protein [Spirochaetes bacterium]|nr:PilZ domain-containing protein [Spirochaetota bacterium]
MASAENRKHPRITINQLVELDFNRENFVRAEAIDLSAGGLLCRTDEYCEPYVVVFIMMTLKLKKGERIIKCEGVVLRCDKKGDLWETAINITSMDTSSEKILKSFLAEHD